MVERGILERFTGFGELSIEGFGFDHFEARIWGGFIFPLLLIRILYESLGHIMYYFLWKSLSKDLMGIIFKIDILLCSNLRVAEF